ncbi:MAG: hypothetical protein RLP09_48615, partial [Sandaracinaceae bacterium]
MTAASSDERAPGEGFLVLWVGGASPEEGAVQASLKEAGVRVELSPLDGLAGRVAQRAPDLVVLAGLAGSAPEGPLEQLRGSPLGAATAVAAIGPAQKASPKPRARYGLVVRMSEETPAEQLAEQLGVLLRGLSRRPARWKNRVELVRVPELAERYAGGGRAGLLIAQRSGALA